MPRVTKFMVLLRTAMASVIALQVAAPTRTDAQSTSSGAYQRAVAAGTVEALEQFIQQYPLSPEANEAFKGIVMLSRGSSMEQDGPSGLEPSAGDLGATRAFESRDPY